MCRVYVALKADVQKEEPSFFNCRFWKADVQNKLNLEKLP
jgi:hypothetical protein